MEIAFIANNGEKPSGERERERFFSSGGRKKEKEKKEEIIHSSSWSEMYIHAVSMQRRDSEWNITQ